MGTNTTARPSTTVPPANTDPASDATLTTSGLRGPLPPNKIVCHANLRCFAVTTTNYYVGSTFREVLQYVTKCVLLYI